MNINQKLNLQQQLGGIVLFNEGVFLRAYNESCYILTMLLSYKLKVQNKRLKCLNYDWIVMSVFPANKLFQRLPNAKVTEFGAQAIGNFDLSGYRIWFNQACRPANEVSRATNSREKEALASGMRENYNSFTNQRNESDPLYLNQQQRNYLSNWKKGHYPIGVDLAFIESLQLTLLKKA